MNSQFLKKLDMKWYFLFSVLFISVQWHLDSNLITLTTGFGENRLLTRPVVVKAS